MNADGDLTADIFLIKSKAALVFSLNELEELIVVILHTLNHSGMSVFNEISHFSENDNSFSHTSFFI